MDTFHREVQDMNDSVRMKFTRRQEGTQRFIKSESGGVFNITEYTGELDTSLSLPRWTQVLFDLRDLQKRRLLEAHTLQHPRDGTRREERTHGQRTR